MQTATPLAQVQPNVGEHRQAIINNLEKIRRKQKMMMFTLVEGIFEKFLLNYPNCSDGTYCHFC